MATAVSGEQIREAIRTLGLAELPVCLHSSLRSFGRVEDGADTVVDAFLAEGCTLLVPTFSAAGFVIAPPEGMRPSRNGLDYQAPNDSAGRDRIFTPGSNELSPSMGAIPAAVLARPGRARGNHPLCSFAALGTGAESLVGEQRPLDVYAPLRLLGARGGFVLLIGVGLERMTLIHLAEEKAGRTLFRRWANGPDGRPMEVEVGSCSDGFGKLEPVMGPLVREARVGASRWRAFPARESAAAAAAAIRERPELTHCRASDCARCADAVAGGPTL